MNTKILEIRLKDLCKKLRNSGKFAQADYFESQMKRIIGPSTEADRKEALQQIISSGKISDMANFTTEEDKLLDFAYEEAKKLSLEGPLH